MENIKKGDKIVYTPHGKNEYILVEEFSTFKYKGKESTLINRKYSITGSLRKPNEFELEVGNFIGISK